MRLLHTKTLELEEFGETSIPRYAILSHTWGKEEITLQDYHANTSMQLEGLEGYEKIVKSCSIAAADGFEHIWIDTCCIDKTSSAELSEAINSMYRWYQDAEECYAYLADVPREAFNRLTGVVSPEFQESRWFNRGWTLQELIAPSTVIFLDKEWLEIGTKLNLHKIISKITGIPGGFLLGDDIGNASIAQRMSWAAKRQTTRVEDLAYCLMGLFGIYMPMIYGEGDRAFIRLQEEILKVSDDHSLFAWRSNEDHGGILATSPAAFEDSGDIAPIDRSYTTSNLITLSSRGIHLSLRFINLVGQGRGLALLDCTKIGKESMGLAIRLRSIVPHKGDYAREQSSMLVSIDLSNIDIPQDPSSLCIRKCRPTRNRKWEDMEMCILKLEGVKREEILPNATDLDPDWKVLPEGVIAINTVTFADGILGRFLIGCRDGNSFQILIKKKGNVILVYISDNTNSDPQIYQDPKSPEEEQHDQDRILKAIGENQHVLVSIKKRVLLLRDVKYNTGVVEIAYHSPFKGIWLEKIAMLERDVDKMTFFSYAARLGFWGVVKLLLETGQVDFESKDMEGRTALSWAAGNGHETVVKQLLETGQVDFESRDMEGRTALSWAAGNGHETVVKLMIQVQVLVDVDLKSKEIQKPRSWATRKLLPKKGTELKSRDRLLLKNSPELDSRDIHGLTPLSFAVRNGRELVVKLLLATGQVNVNAEDTDGIMPLLQAFKRGHWNIVKLLIETGLVYRTASEQIGLDLILWAAELGQGDIIKLLLETQLANNNTDETPLTWAIKNGLDTVVKELLKNIVDVNANDTNHRTPLSLAASGKNETVVKLLLETDRVDVNAGDLHNRTPLSWAASRGNVDIVKLLLGTDGIDVNSKDILGLTPLSWATRGRKWAIVRLLLETNRVDVNTTDMDGRTPLISAVHDENEDIVKLLLQTDHVNIDARDTKGWTPLLWATFNGNEVIVRLLLETNQVDINAKSEDSWTPLSLAVKHKRMRVIILLFELGPVKVDEKDLKLKRSFAAMGVRDLSSSHTILSQVRALIK